MIVHKATNVLSTTTFPILSATPSREPIAPSDVASLLYATAELALHPDPNLTELLATAAAESAEYVP